MFGVSKAFPDLRFAFRSQGILASVVALLGLLVALRGALAFRSHKTTVNPLKPDTASSLVESGIYRRTRNPMYVGLTLATLGFLIWLGHPLALVMEALFPLYIQRFQIEPEERAMKHLFGEAYHAYQTRVPRWL